ATRRQAEPSPSGRAATLIGSRCVSSTRAWEFRRRSANGSSASSTAPSPRPETAPRAPGWGSSLPRSASPRWAGGSGATRPRGKDRASPSSFPQGGSRRQTWWVYAPEGRDDEGSRYRRRSADPPALSREPRGGGDERDRGGGRALRGRE